MSHETSDVSPGVKLTVREVDLAGGGLSIEITVDDVGDEAREKKRPRLTLVEGGKVET